MQAAMFGGFAPFKSTDKHLNYILTLFHLLLDSLAEKNSDRSRYFATFHDKNIFVFPSSQSRIVVDIAGLWTGSFGFRTALKLMLYLHFKNHIC